MTLTTRLTLFYLGTLAAVLTAFSGALYILAHRHLHGELHDRTSGLLDTVTARAEVEPEGVEWEPKHSIPTLPYERDSHFWALYSSTQERLDGGGLPTLETDGHVVRRTITHPEADTLPATLERNRYRTLEFVAALPTAPMQQTLRTLAWSLFAISSFVWLASALAARWICRRALRPVTAMASVAASISPENLGDRLPVPNPADEIRALALSFNGLLARFQSSYERQRRFTGDASHQLRTPLAAMLGQIEVALRRDRDPTEYRVALTTAQSQATRLQGIVESLLFLARADSDALCPTLRNIDLGLWLCESVAQTWGGHARWSDVRIEGATPDLRVEVHPILLGQALGNLIENAFKFSAIGDAVTIRASSISGGVAIDVDDRGDGIDERDRSRLFEPFFRSERARASGTPGVGLGLAVARRIIESMGGAIEWDSPQESGCRFRIVLPAIQPHETSASD